MEYNGWTNWETWQVNLWVQNEYNNYKYIIEEMPYTPFKAQRIALEIYPEGTPDMKGAYELDEVNWEEIAESWNEE